MKKDTQPILNSKTCPGRRDFLKKTLKYGCAGAMGLTIPGLIAGCDPSLFEPVQTPPRTQPPVDTPRVTGCAAQNIRRGYQPVVSSAWIPKGEHTNTYNLFKKTVEAATDFSWLSKGDRVLIKLALNSRNRFPATTDPWALSCVLDLLREKGISPNNILVGDKCGAGSVYPNFQSDELNTNTKVCLRYSGLEDVINGRAIAVDFDDFDFKPVQAEGVSGSVNITRIVDDVDHIIYIPRIATHIVAGHTCSLKISVGFLNIESRVAMHFGGMFHRYYASVNDVPDIKDKFRLTVTSARKLMTTGGPDSGTIVEPNHGLIFASEDILASDLLAASFLNVNRNNQSDIHCHPSIASYISRNGNIEELIWEQLNKNPDVSVTNNMLDQLQKVYA